MDDVTASLPQSEGPRQIGVRATPQLWEQVRDAARANGRSMSAEVISRLERSFLQDDLRQIVREELAERARCELVRQAQELDMGYSDLAWDLQRPR